MIKTFKVEAPKAGKGYIFTIKKDPSFAFYLKLNWITVIRSIPSKAPWQWEINPKDYNQALALFQEYGYTKENE